jgi:hypothetical protein
VTTLADQWIDVSGYQNPAKMSWHVWGIPRGQYRLFLGRRLDPTGPLHRINMRQAGMLTGSYAVPVEYARIVDQAWAWVDAIPDDDENDDWVDAERALLTEAMLDAYCSTYDQRSTRQRLAMYTGWPWWMTHVVALGRQERYARYPLIIAAYPFDTPAGQPVPMDPVSVALRSNPPMNRRPPIPPPWTIESGWQHSGQGSKSGYPRFLDHGIYQVNPGTQPLSSTHLDRIMDSVVAIEAELGEE